MEKFIPYEKLSKKKKRELDRKSRKTWEINPVTRKPENPKAYNRRKTMRGYDSEHGLSILWGNNINCRHRPTYGTVKTVPYGNGFYISLHTIYL